jgi:uncharacterized protein YtpQ (UPF0354 family)
MPVIFGHYKGSSFKKQRKNDEKLIVNEITTKENQCFYEIRLPKSFISYSTSSESNFISLIVAINLIEVPITLIVKA